MEILDTIWSLWHFGVISGIDNEADLDILIITNPMFTNIVKMEKNRRHLRKFRATYDCVKIHPIQLKILHNIMTNGINHISLVKSICINSEYSSLKMVNSDEPSQRIYNMSRIVTIPMDVVGHTYTYKIKIPKENNLTYKFDKIRILHSSCNILSVILTYSSHFVKIFGNYLKISENITDVLFSDTSYTIPSAFINVDKWEIIVVTDNQIPFCEIWVNTLKIIDPDINHVIEWYPCLNNILVHHGAIYNDNKSSWMYIHFLPGGGDVYCRNIDIPNPNHRFSEREMREWLTEHEIVPFLALSQS